MKTILIALTFSLFSCISFAQKTKVAAAYNYLKYEQLDKAKEAIDEAVLDDASMNLDKTWYYRGLIYEQIYNSDKFKYIAPNALDIASISFKKAIELDPNSEYKTEINTHLNSVKTDFFNTAVSNFREKNYAASLVNFESVLRITPDDSTANLYAAYSAEKGGNNAKAIEHYQKIITLKYDDAATYRNLATLYKLGDDNDRALFTLEEGRKKYPDDLDLMLAEINIYLPMGKNNEAIDLLNMAIAKDSKNASLYFALGSTYDNLASPKDAAGNSTLKPEEQKDLLSKAAEAYKKALENKPDYFEANYNLGALYFNKAAEMLSGINGIKDAKEFTEAKQRCDAVFLQAQPYLEKALEINPKDRDTLLSLKQLYQSQNNMEKYYSMKDRLDALGR